MYVFEMSVLLRYFSMASTDCYHLTRYFPSSCFSNPVCRPSYTSRYNVQNRTFCITCVKSVYKANLTFTIVNFQARSILAHREDFLSNAWVWWAGIFSFFLGAIFKYITTYVNTLFIYFYFFCRFKYCFSSYWARIHTSFSSSQFWLKRTQWSF